MADRAATQPHAADTLDTEFTRGLGLFDATMVVVGSMIGSTLLSVIAYWLTFGFIEARHRHVQEARHRATH